MNWEWAITGVCLVVSVSSLGYAIAANQRVRWAEQSLANCEAALESVAAARTGERAGSIERAVADREREIVAAIDAVAVEYIGVECVAVHNALMDLRNMVERKVSEPVEVTS